MVCVRAVTLVNTVCSLVMRHGLCESGDTGQHCV